MAAWQVHDLLFISHMVRASHRDLTFCTFLRRPRYGRPAGTAGAWLDDEDTVFHLAEAH